MPPAISDATERTPKNFLQYVGTFKLNREMHVPADSAVNPWAWKRSIISSLINFTISMAN
jgi:hypothetical protein